MLDYLCIILKIPSYVSKYIGQHVAILNLHIFIPQSAFCSFIFCKYNTEIELIPRITV